MPGSPEILCPICLPCHTMKTPKKRSKKSARWQDVPYLLIRGINIIYKALCDQVLVGYSSCASSRTTAKQFSVIDGEE